MKKSSGFTLVEIIVAVMLISFIAMAFLLGIVNQFALFAKTKEVTRDSFANMSDVEESIKEVRSKHKAYEDYLEAVVTDPSLTDPGNPFKLDATANPNANKLVLFDGSRGSTKITMPTSFIFDDAYVPVLAGGDGIRVDYRISSLIANDNTVVSLAARYTPEELLVPTVDIVEAGIQGTTSKVGYAGDYVELKNVQVIDFTPPVLDKTYKAWNTTDPTSRKYYLPDYGLNFNNVISSYWGAIPHWSSEIGDYNGDYQLVNNPPTFTKNGQNLTPLGTTGKPGTYFIASVYPAAKSGKVGNKVPSSAVFISGLPFKDNLVAHLDASLIEGNYSQGFSVGRAPGDVGEIGSSAIVDDIGDPTVDRRWKDVKDVCTATTPSGFANPRLFLASFSVPVMPGDPPTGSPSIAQYVSFSPGDSSVIPAIPAQSLSFITNSLDPNDFTVFLVARVTIDSTILPTPVGNPAILRGCDRYNPSNAWELHMNGVSMSNVGGDSIALPVGAIGTTPWSLLSFKTDLNKVVLSVNGTDVYNSGTTPFTFPTSFTDSEIFIVDNNVTGIGVDVAEIIIYNNSTDLDSATDAINKYLIEKYKIAMPTPPITP